MNAAASNPAAELTEATCACGHNLRWHHETRGCGYHGYSAEHRCPCLLPFDDAFAAILAARLAAGGAATNDGLRARIEEICRAARGALEPKTCEPHITAGSLLRCDQCLHRSDAFNDMRDLLDPETVLALFAAPTPTEDPAAAPEEPRTEAQIKAEALREALADHEATFGVACSTSRAWLRDRLSRADEGAGS